MSKYLILALIASTLPESARACSMVLEPKFEFDRSVYVFEGRVVGFASDSLAYAGGGYPAWALEGTAPPAGTPMAAAVLIEPTEVVNTPRRAAQFAVFPAGLGSRCEPIYSTEGQLAGRFVVGERVYVVAEQGGPDGLSVNAVPLFAGCCTNVLSRATPLSRVGVDPDPWPDRINLSGDFYDELDLMRAREEGVQAQIRGDEAYQREMAEALVALDGRADFEFERDLARLQSLRSEEERIRLLVKIRAYRFRDGGDCVYARLAERHLRRSRSIDRLGSHLLALEGRPVPTMRMCREAVPIREELSHEGD